jgi:purine-binding chemotaxis protein CheW
VAEGERVHRFLICRAGSSMGAIPLEHVRETLRPLPVRQLAGMPTFVLGVSVVRGIPTPVVDLNCLLTSNTGTPASPPRRFVYIRVGQRSLALAVDDVLGVRALTDAVLGDLPPLVSEIDAACLSSMGTLDAELVLLIEASRVMPESSWTVLEAAGTAQ